MLQKNPVRFISILIAAIPIVLFELLQLFQLETFGVGFDDQPLMHLVLLTCHTYAILAIPLWVLTLTAYQIQISINTGLDRAARWPGKKLRLFQGTFLCVCLIVSAAVTYHFNHTYHDPAMIAWALFMIIGCIVWLTVSLIILSERRHRIKHRPVHNTNKNTEEKTNLLTHPLILPGYLLLLAFIINIHWIQHAMPLDAVGLILFWVSLAFIIRKWSANRSGLMKKLILAIWIVLLSATYISPKMVNMWIVLRNHSILARYSLPVVTPSIHFRSGLPGDALTKTSLTLPGDFDVETWNAANVQAGPYRQDQTETMVTGMGAGWNVILLSIDTLRADHVSCYGYPLPTTPNMDKLAADGVLAKRHYTQGGDSIYSLNSILSGVLPWKFQGREHPVISGILNDAGIQTAYVGYDYVLKGGDFRRDFTHFDLLEGSREDIWGNLTSHILVDKIIERIETLGSDQFFLYCHLLDPHADYLENSETGKFKDSKHMHYDGEIAYADLHIGRLVSYLRESGLLEKTLVIITADHGEAFNEHGHLWHGRYLYDESVRTPLIMTLPDIAGRKVQIPLGPVNIAPTILDFLGLTIPEHMDGVSLLPLIYKGDPAGLPAVEMFIPREKYRKRGWVYGPWKYIENETDGTQELYNLDEDPGEMRNLL